MKKQFRILLAAVCITAFAASCTESDINDLTIDNQEMDSSEFR